MTELSAAPLREHDVVRYTPERTWCRDGMAKAVRRSGDRIVLCETYWRSQGDDSVVAPMEYEVLFNLGDYQLVKQYQWEEFAPSDRRLIRAQHGHCPEFYVRRGATKSHEQIVANAREALAEAEERLRSAEHMRDYRQRELDRLTDLGGA